MEISDSKVQKIKTIVHKLYGLVAELESEFPERHFPLDGHLVGSIGEVIAKYHYGITLYAASQKLHDGFVGDKKVQIKMTQQDYVLMRGKPQFLIVLYLTKDGDIFEVYNGPGDEPCKTSRMVSPDVWSLRVNNLINIDKDVSARLDQKVPIEKMKKEYRNKK